MNGQENIICPFCGDDGFDKIGLKIHLTCWCDEYQTRMKIARDGEKPAMNPNNYASLEASNRLVEAGIVLETDCIWVKWYSDNYPQGEWRLKYKALIQVEEFTEQYPAACFTEVWRELPDQVSRAGVISEAKALIGHKDNQEAMYWPHAVYINTNPTDALIDLLIWVRKEAAMDAKTHPVLDVIHTVTRGGKNEN